MTKFILAGMRQFSPDILYTGHSIEEKLPWFNKSYIRTVFAKDSAFLTIKRVSTVINKANFVSARNSCE